VHSAELHAADVEVPVLVYRDSFGEKPLGRDVDRARARIEWLMRAVASVGAASIAAASVGAASIAAATGRGARICSDGMGSTSLARGASTVIVIVVTSAGTSEQRQSQGEASTNVYNLHYFPSCGSGSQIQTRHTYQMSNL
jgi:hypothetical protein